MPSMNVEFLRHKVISYEIMFKTLHPSTQSCNVLKTLTVHDSQNLGFS